MDGVVEGCFWDIEVFVDVEVDSRVQGVLVVGDGVDSGLDRAGDIFKVFFDVLIGFCYVISDCFEDSFYDGGEGIEG